MRGSRKRTQASDPNAPFFVLLRDAERRILRETLEYHNGNLKAAAETIGISAALIYQRAQILGGVHPGEPRREPFEYKSAKEQAAQERAAKQEAKRLAAEIEQQECKAAIKAAEEKRHAKHRDQLAARAAKPRTPSETPDPTNGGAKTPDGVDSGDHVDAALDGDDADHKYD